MSANGNEESTGEICHSYISVVNAITLYSWTIKLPIYSAWGLLRVCAAWPTPRLDQSYELRPPWEHLTTTSGPQRIQHFCTSVCSWVPVSTICHVFPLYFPPSNKDEEGSNYKSSWMPSIRNVFHDIREQEWAMVVEMVIMGTFATGKPFFGHEVSNLWDFTARYIHIQGVTGGMCETSGECSLC